MGGSWRGAGGVEACALWRVVRGYCGGFWWGSRCPRRRWGHGLRAVAAAGCRPGGFVYSCCAIQPAHYHTSRPRFVGMPMQQKMVRHRIESDCRIECSIFASCRVQGPRAHGAPWHQQRGSRPRAGAAGCRSSPLMAQIPHHGLHHVWQASTGYFWQARWPRARARSKLRTCSRANKGRLQEAAPAVENELGLTWVNEPRMLTSTENKQTVGAAGQRLIRA